MAGVLRFNVDRGRKSTMRLTIEQRVAALERENVVLHDTIKLLHKLLKQQRQLIHDYITQKVTAAGADDGRANGGVRPEDAVYTFMCRRRFEKLEKDIAKMRKRQEGPGLGLKAG
jgi:hypothetical protein